jgi:1,2-diacylglycerol 3-beta-glucosyltransferase
MEILYLVLILIVVSYALYFVVRGLSGLFRKIQGYPHREAAAHFAVLIPARNEEAVIGNLIQSLKKQTYPADLFDVYVLANHCKDSTEEAAKRAGAKVIRCPDTVASKGDVLRTAFRTLKNHKETDAYIIFDADNLADARFLEKMNDAWSAGERLAQGRRLGKNTSDNLLTRCYEIFYNMQNVFFNHSRTSVGNSAILNGTGWMIDKALIDEYGFPTVTMTEDLELTGISALYHIHAGYVHEAVTYDEYPDRGKMALRQLNRWVYGQVQCMRAYAGRLSARIFAHFDRNALDAVLVYLMPLIMLAGLFVLIRTFYLPEGVSTVGDLLWKYLPLLGILCYVFFACMMGTGMHKSGLPVKGNVISLIVYPLFMCILMPIAVVCLFRRKVEWKPITHDRSVRIEDIE